MHPDFNRRPMPSESAVFLRLLSFSHAAGAEGDVGAFLRLF